MNNYSTVLAGSEPVLREEKGKRKGREREE
jgi:hypothetical protein